jgi:hypothetical protein
MRPESTGVLARSDIAGAGLVDPCGVVCWVSIVQVQRVNTFYLAMLQSSDVLIGYITVASGHAKPMTVGSRPIT